MTYEEFAASIRNYLENNTSGTNLTFIICLSVGIVLFFVWFSFYLRKEYLRRKKSVDTFDAGGKEDIKYPGFHRGVFKDAEKVTFEKDIPYSEANKEEYQEYNKEDNNHSKDGHKK